MGRHVNAAYRVCDVLGMEHKFTGVGAGRDREIDPLTSKSRVDNPSCFQAKMRAKLFSKVQLFVFSSAELYV